jgi:transcriptional regulator with XRE-family HTH domain
LIDRKIAGETKTKTIHDRIRAARKALKLNQAEFGAKIEVTGAAVSDLERGRVKTVTERNIKAICHAFHVAETWLRTGEGEMFQPTDDAALSYLIGKLMAGDDVFKKRFITLALHFTDAQWGGVKMLYDDGKQDTQQTTERVAAETTRDRIHMARKALKLNQTEFGDRMNLSAFAVSDIEKGKTKTVTERNIKAICREFNMNETWLRTGEGEMFRPTDDETLSYLIGKLIAGDDAFKKRFVALTLQLTDEQWESIKTFIAKLLSKEI